MTATRHAASRPGPARHLSTLGIVLVGIGVAVAFGVSTPVYSSGDEAAHVDYALQVWTGQLPVFEDGLVLQNENGQHPPVQWTAQHPPLFYVILAPVVGPLVGAGDVDGAAQAARLVVGLLGVALLLVVRRFAEAVAPQVPGVGTLAAVVTGLSVWWARLAGAVYNDILAALLVAASATLLLRLLRDPRPRLFVGFTVMMCAAGLTRLSLLPLCFVMLVVLLVHRTVVDRQGPLVAVRQPLATGCAILLTSGWFYARNVALTGSITGGHPDWAEANTGRSSRPLWDVVVDLSFWERMTQQLALSTGDEPPWDLAVPWGNVVLLGVPVLVGVAVGLRRVAGGRRRVEPVALVLIVVSSAVIVLLQLQHVAGAGSALPRYFFALMPFLSPLLAVALLRVRPAMVAVLAWVAIRSVLLGHELVVNLTQDWGEQAPIYPAVATVAAVLAAVGLVVAIRAIVLERQERPEHLGRPEHLARPRTGPEVLSPGARRT